MGGFQHMADHFRYAVDGLSVSRGVAPPHPTSPPQGGEEKSGSPVSGDRAGSPPSAPRVLKPATQCRRELRLERSTALDFLQRLCGLNGTDPLG